MYSRKRSSGSWPARRARRLAAALASPESVRAATRVDRPVHLPGFHHLVAQERRVRVTRGPFPAREDRLAGGAVPDEPGQAQVGRPRMIPSLRAGRNRRDPRVAITWLNDVQKLAGPANREAFHRRHPQLLGPAGRRGAVRPGAQVRRGGARPR